MVETILILGVGGGFVAGMYFATQISEWIEGRIEKKVSDDN